MFIAIYNVWRKKALLIQIGVQGVDDIITSLAKEREPRIEIIKHTPYM